MTMFETVPIWLICIYGFLKYLRPSETFLTPYLLTSHTLNLTTDQLSQSIYPIWTYTYFLFTIPVFLLSDFFHFRLLILLEGLAYTLAWLLLIFGKQLWHIQIMEMFYGLGTALEVALYGFLYSNVSEEQYKSATSRLKSFTLLGKFSASLGGQWIFYKYSNHYDIINFTTLGSTVLSTLLIAFVAFSTRNPNIIVILKPDDQSKVEEQAKLYFPGNTPIADQSLYNQIVKYFTTMRAKFTTSYGQSRIRNWSVWWALAQAGILQVSNYVQNFWALWQHEDQNVYNGWAQGCSTLLCAIVVFSLQYTKSPMKYCSEGVLFIFSTLTGLSIVAMCRLSIDIIESYVFYCLCRLFYQVVNVLVVYNLAKVVPKDSYGLVFGFNTFLALCLQCVITLLIADKNGFALNIRNQFLIYGAYFGLVGFLILLLGTKETCQR